MHQLRVHLAHLGHPILNDPLYGLAGTRHAATPVPLAADAAAEASTARIVAAITARHAVADDTHAPADPATPAAATDPLCFECTVRRPDPQPEELFLCLHAHRYAGATWAYTAPPPAWATPGAVVKAVVVRGTGDGESDD